MNLIFYVYLGPCIFLVSFWNRYGNWPVLRYTCFLIRIYFYLCSVFFLWRQVYRLDHLICKCFLCICLISFFLCVWWRRHRIFLIFGILFLFLSSRFKVLCYLIHLGIRIFFDSSLSVVLFLCIILILMVCCLCSLRCWIMHRYIIIWVCFIYWFTNTLVCLRVGWYTAIIICW